jgi:type II secretory pathway pseudopilin PulG
MGPYGRMGVWGVLPRGGLLIEMSVVMGVTGLLLGLMVPFYIHAQRAGREMESQARAVAAARETAAQIRRDVQAASGVRVTRDQLSLELPAVDGSGRAVPGRQRQVVYASSGAGWARRTQGDGDAPLWLREEVRQLGFAREGVGVRATIECRGEGRHAQPVRVECFAVPRNGRVR